MNIPMPNAPTGELRTFFVLKVWARPAGGGVPVRCVTANPDKEKQKEKQKRHHDTDHEKLLDEATFDEDSMPGEAERPSPPSEKPEACQNRAVSQKAPRIRENAQSYDLCSNKRMQILRKCRFLIIFFTSCLAASPRPCRSSKKSHFGKRCPVLAPQQQFPYCPVVSRTLTGSRLDGL